MTPSQTSAAPALLSKRIIDFTNHMRANGFTMGPQECIRIAQHLSSKPLPTMQRVRLELKTLLAGDRQEWSRFDDLFEAYWIKSGRTRASLQQKSSPHITRPERPAPLWQQHLSDNRPEGDGKTPQIEFETGDQPAGKASGRLIAAKHSVNRKTDLKNIVDPDEIRAAEALALQLARAMRYRLSRRYKTAKKGNRLDLRKTIRSALPRGGEPIELFRRSTRPRPVHIIVFLDVSGSMKHYSRFFLQFVKGLVCAWLHSDAFVFHTRLIHVTDAVRDRNSARAMTRLALMAEGFGGGTKLGECLGQFNRHYARKMANSRTVAIVLSDGYDTGAPEKLEAELARMKKHIRKLIWLNPLLGWKNYAPITAAMLAARPHIDYFAAANTLESLAALEPQLAQL